MSPTWPVYFIEQIIRLDLKGELHRYIILIDTKLQDFWFLISGHLREVTFVVWMEFVKVVVDSYNTTRFFVFLFLYIMGVVSTPTKVVETRFFVRTLISMSAYIWCGVFQIVLLTQSVLWPMRSKTNITKIFVVSSISPICLILFILNTYKC